MELLRVLADRPEAVGLPSVTDWRPDLRINDATHDPTPPSHRERFSLLGRPTLWLLGVASACMYVTRYAVNSWGVLYLQEAHHYDLVEAGSLISINTFAGIGGSALYGWVSDRFFASKRPPPTLIFGHRPDVSLVVSLGGVPRDVLIFGRDAQIFGRGAVWKAPAEKPGDGGDGQEVEGDQLLDKLGESEWLAPKRLRQRQCRHGAPYQILEESSAGRRSHVRGITDDVDGDAEKEKGQGRGRDPARASASGGALAPCVDARAEKCNHQDPAQRQLHAGVDAAQSLHGVRHALHRTIGCDELTRRGDW